MNVAHPLSVDRTGRTARSDYDAHVNELILQLLLTSPGERVMRPTFGCGLGQLVFEPNNEVAAGATQLLIQSALQQWLGKVVDVISVSVVVEDSTLAVTVTYAIRKTGEERTTTVSKST